jgi:curli biogenesis system outer membrane secretion channel CsgG
MNRRQCFFVCTAAFLLVTLAQTIPASSQDAPKRRPRIAVLDFDYGTVQTASAALFGTNVDVGKGIVDLLVTGLVKDGTYSIIERKALDKILAEQNFSNSDRADPSSAAKIGKLLGVDAIIEGSITEFGNETKKTNLGGGGGNWHGFGVGGFGHSNSKANVAITARIINIDTGEILAAADGQGQSARSSTSMLGGGGNWHGWGGGNADFGSSDFQQTIIGEATKAAVDQLTTNLVSDAGKVGVRTVIVEGVVAAVDGGQVILNVGARAGIKVGDQLQVLRVTKEIKDPSTGNVLRRLTTTVGTIRATDVDDVSAICAPVSGTDFKAGDRVKTVTQ